MASVSFSPEEMPMVSSGNCSRQSWATATVTRAAEISTAAMLRRTKVNIAMAPVLRLVWSALDRVGHFGLHDGSCRRVDGAHGRGQALVHGAFRIPAIDLLDHTGCELGGRTVEDDMPLGHADDAVAIGARSIQR